MRYYFILLFLVIFSLEGVQGKNDLIRLPESPDGFTYLSLESPGMIIRLVPVRD
jgi:hypothetical protein